MNNPAQDCLKCKECEFILVKESDYIGDWSGMWFYSTLNNHIVGSERVAEDNCVVKLIYCSQCGEQIGHQYKACTQKLWELEGLFGIRYDKAVGKATISEKIVILRNLYATTRETFINSEEQLSKYENTIEKMIKICQVISKRLE
ncbi:unnamed protein product [Blepharisma stoltei]|uniref:Protein yippee-like n=1 Tax=Blepharisma stoltei TaxID=1481888 RepID=A0AAU9J8K5_9CILI|nr:unnamed protein product [Blepharisma stoltei]